MTRLDPAEAGPKQVGACQQVSPPVVGAVVHLADAGTVATDVLERMGPVWCLQLAALLTLLSGHPATEAAAIGFDLFHADGDQGHLLDIKEMPPSTDHPAPGARPGEVIAIGPAHRWIAYQTDGHVVAACYLAGGLLRRDLAGWWTATFLGERNPVADSTVAPLVGSVPDGWPVLACQGPLLGKSLLDGEVEA